MAGSGVLEVHLVDAKGLTGNDFLGEIGASYLDPRPSAVRRRRGRSSSISSAFLSCAGKIDPYVVVQYRSQERKSSVARDQGKNPSWNEVFKFQINSTAATGQHKLFLRLMDHDTFSRDDFLGEATINVTDLISLGMEHGTWEMSESKHRVVLADKTYHGEIRVSLTFTASAKAQDHAEQVGGWVHSFRQ
uniref:C2 domain-containing protein n=1 Tax=Oryza glaberrima TaxID=4538 RepID=I1NT77_ORYGL